MGRVRVLIVDDSALVRRLLQEVLSSEQDIEVVGTASNAAIALSRIETLSPDVVTLDIEMPDMSGLELLAEIRKRAPKLPVIMFSSLTQRGAATTLDALALGATDYVTKPTGASSREAALEQVRTQLVPKLRVLAPRAPPGMERLNAAQRRERVSFGETQRVSVLAVGCSTGGPNALAEIFGRLSCALAAPVLIVQHMPPLFTRMLADRLGASGPLRVREASHGDVLTPGGVWIAPGDFHMRVERQGLSTVIALDKGPPENSCRPAVDVLFRSVAEVYGERALALVLTGMGQDGLRGAEAIHARGGRIIAQDEASSVVWGMPGAVVRAGLAGSVLPLQEIADDVTRRVGSSPAFGASRLNQEGRRVG
ncbi:MAG: chemotaxis response regulator protein-glutamate methylesterase [Polyangiales bacterium]